MPLDNTIGHHWKLLAIGVLLAGVILTLTLPDGIGGVNRQPNFVHVLEVAQKIKSRELLKIVDLRDSADFEEFHIPTATHIPLDQLKLEDIDMGMVFYSGSGPQARMLWDRLSDSLRNHMHILYGGAEDWYDRILYPELPFGEHNTNPELVDSIHNLTEFYGGFASFEQDSTLLQYYEVDLTKARWPKVQRKGSLVRKGC